VKCTALYSHSESVAIQTVYGLGAPFSIIGSGFILLSAIMFPKLRKTTAIPIFALSFADFFKSILYLSDAIGNPGDKCVTNQWCACSGGLRNFFGLASFLFIAAIATMGFLSAGGKIPGLSSWDQDFVKSDKWTIVHQAVGWGFPAFSLLIIYTASNDVIGDVGGKCWITSEYRYLRWLMYYLPLLLIFIYVCILCYLTYKLISNIGVPDDIRKKIRNRLMMYSLIFVFIRFWSLLDTIISSINGHDRVFFFTILHSLFSPWQGFANAYVYGIRNVEVKRKWKAFYEEHLAEHFGGESVDGGTSAIDAIEPKALEDEGDDC